jgi:cytochrome c oxidase subunit 3
MHNVERTKLQAFPFHLVDPSPWPILTSFSLLSMAIGAVLYFHGFNDGGNLLLLGFILTASAMTLWFKDVIFEGTCLFLIRNRVFNL